MLYAWNEQTGRRVADVIRALWVPGLWPVWQADRNISSRADMCGLVSQDRATSPTGCVSQLNRKQAMM